ncbi:Hypothetical protein CINCED_3A020489 [Cinara cedri]|uniref:ABC transporter type 1, transmembrane domain,ABC transporter-like,P-loop containing nucleoside triphosphate n=1 Tax=Cinara cedri TaxID=506608 RepID=A0A5E4M2F9_9HEMI|nr:Hypothetical protein CINCED_3A020489 [Cinara cedri]
MDGKKTFELPRHPIANSNIFEILTFSWILNLFKTGSKRDLELNDLYSVLNEHKSSSLGDDLEKKWRSELVDADKTGRNPSLLRALIKVFGTNIMLNGLILAIGEIIIKVSQPLFIGKLLLYFHPEKNDKTDKTHAYVYASGLIVSLLSSMALYHSSQMAMFHFGMKMRIACCATIYRKALRLSKAALNETTVGQMINLLSNDVNRFDTSMPYMLFLWISPLQTVVVTYFLWQEIGVSSVLGLAAIIMQIPLQGWLGTKTSRFRMKTAMKTDERVRLMNEIIAGIQVIKMYTWEKPFEYLVQCARKNEIDQIRGSAIIKAIWVACMSFNTRVALFFSIFSYVMLGNYITARKVFVVTSYYSHLRLTMTILFPQAIGLMSEVLVSIKRLQPASKNLNNIRETVAQFKNFAIVFSSATAKWTNGQTENSLENINLTVTPGRLVAIIGPVGAGKSSIIQAILRELPLSEGTVSVRGIVSYASQEPWLFAGSVRQNILFGSPMDKDRYKKVVQVCALKTDFQQFPYGDRTIVGERGVSLSGGQRARINLARAVYKKANIYLLDDPLSAVDTQVSRHIFEKCIKDFLGEKTCILVTHQIQYLVDVDKIVLMENAKVSAEGTYEDLRASNLNFTKSLQSQVETKVVADNNYSDIQNENNSNGVNSKCSLSRQLSIKSCSSTFSGCKDLPNPTEVIETSSSGNISYSIYSSYFTAGGRIYKIIFFIFICILTQVLTSWSDLWVAYWVNLEEHVFCDRKISPKPSTLNTFLWWTISRRTCVYVFGGLTLTIILATGARAATFVSVCTTASMNLHTEMFNAITRAPMLFFNTNTSGRILNRFSKDIGAIDDMLPVALMDCIHYGSTILGISTVVGIVNVYLTIPTLILAFVCYKITTFCLSTSRSIKRLEGMMRSPVYAYLNASLQGITTIRAFEAEPTLSQEFDNHQDSHSTAWFLYISSTRAYGFWLDLVCLIYIGVVTFSFIVISDGTFSGNVGLAITQAFGFAGVFQWAMRQSAELENHMTSVERVLEYTNVSREGALESLPNKKPSLKWPMSGRIIFENFYLQYESDMPYVIKNLNIHIEPMEKVGIVGRTGAGKTSLISAMFRLALNQGNIIIDGVEIHELGLHDVRSKISIIPQEPILFSGTMRTNLDPFNAYPDHILWEALDEVELKGVVEDLPNGLNARMSEGGSNFSVGQRQLVCLARAIVRNNKIIVLDEATANVDPQTDALIQKTIRKKFRTCTILTIAHRLNTVMDSDKVLVMNAGAAVEFNHPHNLLKNKNGHFYKMVEQMGRATADSLHAVAAKNYNMLKPPTIIIEMDRENGKKKD